jgi:Ferritin-like
VNVTRQADLKRPADIKRLRDLLQAAVELELSTIPPYLCALYSLWPGSNNEAGLIIRSVAVEEMLHMVLAANVLNAIGGEPRVTGPAHVPRYPHELPDGVVLDLLPFCPEAVEEFLKVENPQYPHQGLDPGHPLVAGRRPERHLARAAAMMGGTAAGGTAAGGPTTIGAFYAEIVGRLKEAAAALGEQALFCGDPARQVTREYYYAGGGSPLPVKDLASALAALTEIVDQGEGDPASRYDADGDLAHYYRFKQLACGRSYLPSDDAGTPSGPPLGVDYGAVYPMIANPRGDDYADPELRAAAGAASRTWSALLRGLEAGFNGRPDALLAAVPAMFRLRDQALVLLANPLPSGGASSREIRHAGPTFEWADGPVTARRPEEGSTQ